MHFLYRGLLFVTSSLILNVVKADECLLDEPQPECESYCFRTVKPFLSYAPSTQKRLEACESLKPSYDLERLEKIDNQLAQQLELSKSLQTKIEACERPKQLYGQDKLDKIDRQLAQQLELTKLLQNQILSCSNLQKVESKLESMENQFKQEVEKVEATEETLREQRKLREKCENEMSQLSRQLESTKSLQDQLVSRSRLEDVESRLQQEVEKVNTCRANTRATEDSLREQRRLTEKCQNEMNQLSQQLESTKSLQDQLVSRSSLQDVETRLRQEEEKVETCRASIRTTEGTLVQQQSLTEQCKNERRKFRKLGLKYYHIENSEGLPWMGALQRCAEWGGHLVSFQNEQEWNFVRQALKIYGSYWVDINDLDREGIFVSATSGVAPRFVKWYRGEPNNGFAGTEHCVELGYNQQFHMNDGRCHLRNNFICESSNERVFIYNA